MKKNHPHRRPETARNSTVRPDRILSEHKKHNNSGDGSLIHRVEGNYKGGRNRLAASAGAVVFMLIALPLSCKLLPYDENGETTMPTDMIASSFSDDGLVDDSTYTESTTVDTEATLTDTNNSDSETDTQSSETAVSSETTPAITETVVIDPYPRADSSLLPDLKNYNEAELDDISNILYGWSFHRPAEKHKDQPAGLPAGAAETISPFTVIWQLKPTEQPTVYLTMDEGYEYADNTSRILDTALEKQAGITFFITGSFLTDNPELVLRMKNEGHQIANHTVSHPSLAKLLLEQGGAEMMVELTELESSYEKLTGAKMSRLIRPPMGEYSPRMLAVLNSHGFVPVFWSFAYVDWYVDKQPVPSAALDQILGELHDGSVILIHAVSKTNVEILPELIDGIRERGYEIMLLPEP